VDLVRGLVCDPGKAEGAAEAFGTVETVEFARYPDPLAPAAAARLSGRPPVDVADVATRVASLAGNGRLVLVEGAGGLLVRYDDGGSTLADVARLLTAPVLVVTEAGLGTLNATALTLEALAHRGLVLAGVVVGAWPERPDLAVRSNLAEFERLSAQPLAGAIPADAGLLDHAGFFAVARAGLAPSLGGQFDARQFVRQHWVPAPTPLTDIPA
jgi:dethiobiotin synthetase